MRAATAVGWSGKVKTATQLVAIFLLLLAVGPCRPGGALFGWGGFVLEASVLRAGTALIWTATALAVTSGVALFASAGAALRRPPSGANDD